MAVIRSKKRSTSSIYSLRNYTMHKYTLTSSRMTMIFITYYNLIIERQFYLSRWLKILDMMLEKGKGLVLDKFTPLID